MFYSRQQEANENKQKGPCLRREGGKKVHFGSSVVGLEFCLDVFVLGLWEIGVFAMCNLSCPIIWFRGCPSVVKEEECKAKVAKHANLKTVIHAIGKRLAKLSKVQLL